MDVLVFKAEEVWIGKRIDAFLTSQVERYSRTYLQKCIEDGGVTVNGKIIKVNYKLRQGDEITLRLPENVPLEITAENIPLEIVYEDADVIVVNKPQGMVVHPAHGNYEHTMVNALLYHCKNLSGINGVLRPGIVHRIDKDTSGLIMIAKTNEAHMDLSDQLKAHSITRRYQALVEGRLKEDSGVIDAPIGRSIADRKKMTVTEKNGKHAVTHYRVLERFERYTLIEARLETGRTHQIRVHMAHIGHPVVGDPVYGYARQQFTTNGQLLHAKVLGFIHPVKKEYMVFEAELPDYFQEILQALRKREGIS